MREAMYESDRVREVTMFVLRRKGSCFADWRPAIVFRYIAFHDLAGTLEIVREGRALLGIGIDYPCNEAWLRESEGKPFEWQLPEPGNALFIGDVVSCRQAIPKLWRMGLAKCPWVTKIFTYRRKKLVELPMATIERLARKGSCVI